MFGLVYGRFQQPEFPHFPIYYLKTCDVNIPALEHLDVIRLKILN